MTSAGFILMEIIGNGQTRWGWRAFINMPATRSVNFNRTVAPIEEWCRTQWGMRDHAWARSSNEFLFFTKEQAMLFKLRWHGQPCPA